MLRVRFTAEDLSRTRFCAAPAPLMEAGLALQQLRQFAAALAPARSRRAAWLSQARRAFPAAARPLLDLVPKTGLAPQFLDPMVTDLEEGLEMVRASPRLVLRTDLELSWQTRPDRDCRPPAWVRDLADGDREAIDVVVRAQRAFFAACVAPHWPVVLASFRGDVARRIPVLATRGQAELFSSFHPALRWQGQALQKAGRRKDVWLGGHGLQIMPSAFLTGPPLFAIRLPELGGNALIYPAEPSGSRSAPGAGDGRAVPGTAAGPDSASLAVLLGRTRAAALGALREPCGTAELAARLQISTASASEHAKALRDAGLIETARSGRAVRHSLTHLGSTLLSPGPRRRGPGQERGAARPAGTA